MRPQAARIRACRNSVTAARQANTVTAYGRVCMHHQKINISTVLAGQLVGLKEVEEGIWLVSFMH
jgi:hypothetical protein